MATHSSILAWRIPWTEELGGLQSTGRKELDTTERLHFHFTSLRYTDDTTLMAETKEELQSLLMRVKEESQRATSKLNIKKIKVMVSSPITSWQIEGEKVEAVTDFLFGGL